MSLRNFCLTTIANTWFRQKGQMYVKQSTTLLARTQEMFLSNIFRCDTVLDLNFKEWHSQFEYLLIRMITKL